MIYDTGLYLNTHPTDQEALRHYHCHRELLEAAIDKYFMLRSIDHGLGIIK